MKYEIYCDESCIEALFDKTAHRYIVIGGIWLPAECRAEMKETINGIKQKYGKMGELKWKKVAPSSVAMYKELIDLFFDKYQVRFRAICIEANKVNHSTFNNGNGELGFYKFYFQLIQHWLIDGNEYSLFLDYKVNGHKHRVQELKKILQYSTNASVTMAQALPSKQSLLIQLADVLTGATASSFNGDLKGSKLEVCRQIEKYIGHCIQGTSIQEQKFNVFDINLRQGW